MIPMRTSSVFKSRWMALIWAAGIIHTFVGVPFVAAISMSLALLLWKNGVARYHSTGS